MREFEGNVALAQQRHTENGSCRIYPEGYVPRGYPEGTRKVKKTTPPPLPGQRDEEKQWDGISGQAK